MQRVRTPISAHTLIRKAAECSHNSWHSHVSRASHRIASHRALPTADMSDTNLGVWLLLPHKSIMLCTLRPCSFCFAGAKYSLAAGRCMQALATLVVAYSTTSQKYDGMEIRSGDIVYAGPFFLNAARHMQYRFAEASGRSAGRRPRLAALLCVHCGRSLLQRWFVNQGTKEAPEAPSQQYLGLGVGY